MSKAVSICHVWKVPCRSCQSLERGSLPSIPSSFFCTVPCQFQREERPRGDYRLPTYQIGPEAGHPWVTRQKPPSRSGLCFLIPRPPGRVILLPPTVPLMVPPLLTGRPQPSFLFGEGKGDFGCPGEGTEYPCHTNRAISFYFELFKLYF